MEAKHQWQARLALWQSEAHGHAYALAAAERILVGAERVSSSFICYAIRANDGRC